MHTFSATALLNYIAHRCRILLTMSYNMPMAYATVPAFQHPEDTPLLPEPLEVQQLAEMCHMSYSNFARLFRENYGRSCKEYIKYIRLNKAQDLLLNSDYDLDYIAQETGFFDCSHFIRTYKKWRGITPKQERMQNREVL